MVCEAEGATGGGTPDASGSQFGTFIKITFPSSSDVPAAPLMWNINIDIDTDTSVLCDTHNSQATRYCVVAATSITLASTRTLRAHGSKPLVLLAISTFDLQGTIDVSSNAGSPPGAGAAVAASCPNTTAAAGNSGGFGGSFGGKGGNGGPIAGTADGATGTAAPALAAFPTDLRGGCPGGNGSSSTAGTAPAGGSGGGAVAIIADTVQVNGKINASGASGKGGPATLSGGGGGGAGGMIVLDAPSIMPGSGTLWLFANGGGGGQGGTGMGIGAGPGDDGKESPGPLINAVGGNNGGRSGGAGGGGSAGTAQKDGADAGDAVNSGGGGAGGGGTGFIRTLPIAGAVIAPPPISM
jgi:hypothetical protein